SPYWALLADWVKIRLTLPDPPPDPLRFASEVVTLTAISSLAQHLPQETGQQLRTALNAALEKANARAAQAGR
ncbi:hypothetical protein, partial [Pseudomonas sp. MPR-AND1A]|uniref:hypothetical protein n=1 Tax=Pseudomonas sp. MPR-AND1A TaxID=2070600 RepID=UPI001304A869